MSIWNNYGYTFACYTNIRKKQDLLHDKDRETYCKNIQKTLQEHAMLYWLDLSVIMKGEVYWKSAIVPSNEMGTLNRYCLVITDAKRYPFNAETISEIQ